MSWILNFTKNSLLYVVYYVTISYFECAYFAAKVVETSRPSVWREMFCMGQGTM